MPDSPKPTFKERFEAITQTLESVAGMQRDLTAKMDVLTERTIQAMAAINRLAVATAANTDKLDGHEERIERLEDRS